MKVNANVAANYVSQIYTGLVGFSFVPICIRFLGIEAYGLIGIFSIIQNSTALLDLGLRPTMAREMARYRAGARDLQSVRDLLRSVQIVAACAAALVAMGIWAMSAWLSNRWLNSGGFSKDTVADAIAEMGLICALRIVENVYVGSVIGMQRQVTQCIVNCALVTARAIGSVIVLALIAPTIQNFFIWQVLISFISIPVYAFVVSQSLPVGPRAPRFSKAAISGVWIFSGGVAINMFLAFLLTQSDKILLSARLPLKAFSYYAVVSTLSGGLNLLSLPISAAFYPLFAELSSRGHIDRLRIAYHQAAQLMAALMASAAIVLAVFADTALAAWTGDADITLYGAPILRVLALGALVNGFLAIPYQLQLATGWTSLTAKLNAVMVCTVVPALLVVIPRYGAIGAAWIWVALNTGNMVLNINLMHRRLLADEKWRWYGRDVLAPTVACALGALLFRTMAPQPTSRTGGAVVLMTAFMIAALAGALACSSTRKQLQQLAHIVRQRA